MAEVRYSPTADVLYVLLGDPEERVERSFCLDDSRNIDYSGDGRVIGVEFIDASAGIDLAGVPFAAAVEQLIGSSGTR